MKYKDIKAGETYNMRIKVNSINADCGEVGTIPVDQNGKELKNEWAYYSRYIASALSTITHENGTKNTEPAPKYDLCRLFRKGDKVRLVPYRGRAPIMFGSNVFSIGEIFTVEEDENKEYDVIINGASHRQMCQACFLELVTPVEELEPFYVGENTESKSFEVRRKEDHKVQAAFYYFNEDDAHAKSEAAKATLEHCDRLNAEHRKENQQ